MTRLPIQTVDSAPAASKPLLQAVQKSLGMVPNMAGAMASSPAVLASWVQMNTSLAGGELPAPIRERLALFAAETNECGYCLGAHAVLGKMAGLNAEEIEAARCGESADPRALAAITFAQRVLETRGGIDASDLDAVREAGFSDAQIAEIVGAVALNLFTNIFNRAFDVEIDFPRVEPRVCTAG